MDHLLFMRCLIEMFKDYNKQSETISSDLFITRPGFACSKLVIETLEQGVKYVQS